MAGHPIAFCKNHGFFPSTEFELSGNANVGIYGVSVHCPSCDGISEIIPGEYSVFRDKINLLVDKSLSVDALNALREIALRAQRSEITPTQAKQQAEVVSKGAGRLFDVADWSDQAKATLYAAIIGGITLVAVARISSSPQQTINVHPVVVERIYHPPGSVSAIGRILPPLPAQRPAKPQKKHQ